MLAALPRSIGQMRTVLPPLLALAAAAPSLAEEKPPGGALPPESYYVRTARAARRTGPITLDGLMNEPAWEAAPLQDDFTQVNPDEGKPASVKTAFRVLWDDEYLYFGAICDDPEPPTISLSRRDRFIEGDSVQFDLDTTLDRRTAYHFQVFAAGQQLDAIHFNDTDFTTDWDAAWDSAVARTPTGWSAEMRIPLRVLRIPVGVKTMGFNVYRILSRRKEEDQWRFRPNGRPGDISRLGLLDGIEGIHPVRALELRPYLAMKVLRNVPAYATPRAELGSCATVGFDPQRQGGLCAGLDFRYNLASDLALVGTVNPDFGQVEADQRVLNLTTFETFFPEKRPFFLEGLDLFKPALRVDINGGYGGDAYQIFYSRRIGRSTPSHDDLNLGTDQKIVYQQPSVPVVTAMKLSGTVAGASVGVLSALEPRVTAQVLQPNGRVEDLRAVEARSDSVFRVRAPLGGQGLLGFSGTAVDPLFTSAAQGFDHRHAHVGEADVIVYNADRTWDFTAQGAGSLLTGHTPDTLRDGTFRGETVSGYAASTRIHHSEEYWAAALNTDLLSPGFTVNDLGFMPRANMFRAMGYVAVRDPHPSDKWQSWQVILGGREVQDYRFAHRLNRDALLEGWVTTKSFWYLDTGIDAFAPYVDDRELYDGTPLERQAALQWYTFMNTDSRKPVQLQLNWQLQRSFPRFERLNQIGPSLVFRPMPRLDGQLDLSYSESAGTIRQIALPSISPDTTQTRVYILAPQQARSLSATLRATYAFTPYLTLQAYGQLFTADIVYGAPLRAEVGPGRRTVSLAELQPALPNEAPDKDERQVGLNVNLILRWEWRTGSTFYLVYAHQSSNDQLPPTGPRGLNIGQELSALNAAGVAHGDTVLLKVDLLSAL
jgi:hypothetical protein